MTSLHLVSSNCLFSPLKKIKLVKGHKELLVPMYDYFASRFSCNRTRNRGRRGITAGRERTLCSLRCYLLIYPPFHLFELPSVWFHKMVELMSNIQRKEFSGYFTMRRLKCEHSPQQHADAQAFLSMA